VGSRQVACFEIDCQDKRKAAARARWQAGHPNCFEGRRAKHKEYRGVQKALRLARAHVEQGEIATTGVPEQDEIATAGMAEQDEITAQEAAPTGLNGVLCAFLGASGEQDEISAQRRVLIGLIASHQGLSTEQDELGVRVAMLDNLGRRVLERVARPARTPERAIATLARGGGPS
jgi:hypothetical protein